MDTILKEEFLGCLGGLVSWASNFGSGHDLTVREFEPCIGLCADSSEPASDSVSHSFSAPPSLMFCLSISLSTIKKNFF